MSAPRLVFRLAAAGALLLAAAAHGAALVETEQDMLVGHVPRGVRVRRQQSRYGGQDGARYNQYDQYDDNLDQQDAYAWNGNQGTRGRGSARQNQASWQYSSTTTTLATPRAQDDPSTRTSTSWGSGVDVNGFGGGSDGGGLFGGGLFGGNRPSIIGSLISRLGQGVATTVRGVSTALANKWNTKVLAARGLASSLFSTGRAAARSGLQAGMAHPQFAIEAVENVL